MANDEEPVEKALVASSSVAVTSKDSANSNLATLMAPAESFPGEAREPLLGEASTPLSGGASTPLSGRASTPCGVRTNDEEPVEKALMASSSVAVTSEDSANSNLATLVAREEYFLGEVREPLSGRASTPLSGGASTPSGVRASPETARPSPALVPATIRTEAAICNNRIHRPNVVTRRAAAELTGAVTRYRGVCPNNNNHAALAECFQPITLHKLRQLGLSTNTDTPDDNDINNNNHAALAKRFEPNTLHKVRQLDRCTNKNMSDTAQQLDAEAVPAEVTYTRSNTQPSCSGGGEVDRVLQGGHVRFTPSYVVTLANAPIIFKVGLQGLAAQSTMEAEFVAAALIMKKGAVSFPNMMLELDFDKSFGGVPLHIDNTSVLYIAGNRTHIPRAIALRYYFFVQELVEGKVNIHYVKSEDQLADLGTKHQNKHRHRDLIKLISVF